MTRVKRSMRNWFRAHRRQVAIHACVIAGFLAFTLFVAEPLFDRLERIPGEAQLHRLSLPATTDGMTHWFDELRTDGQTAVEIRGWAFIWGEDSCDQEVYIVLKSAYRTYAFGTETVIKEGVTRQFDELNLNLDESGFTALIPARKIAAGEYTIGIYVRKGDIEALQYTNKSLVKSRGIIEVTG